MRSPKISAFELEQKIQISWVLWSYPETENQNRQQGWSIVVIWGKGYEMRSEWEVVSSYEISVAENVGPLSTCPASLFTLCEIKVVKISSRFSSPWGVSRQNTGVRCHILLQELQEDIRVATHVLKVSCFSPRFGFLWTHMSIHRATHHGSQCYDHGRFFFLPQNYFFKGPK